MDRHGAQSGKLTGINRRRRPRSLEGGVFGRSAGPDEGVFAGEALARALALTMIAGAAAPGFSPLLGSAFDGLFGWRVIFLVVAASGRRERYSRALARKGHGGPGLVEQDGGLFKSFDAAFDAKSNDEKNHGAVEVRISMYSIRQKARTVVRPRSRLACQSPNPCSGNCRSGSLVRSLVPQSAFDKSLRKQNGLPVRCVHATETRASGKGWAWPGSVSRVLSGMALSGGL